MSTIYVFHDELSSLDSLATDDVLLGYDTSSGRTKKLTGAQAQDKVVTSETTLTAIANTGVSILSNTTTTTKAYLLADPVAGRRKTIMNASGSTLGKTVTVASTASGYSSLTTLNSTSTVLTFTTADSSVELIGVSATKWQIVANVNTVACT